MTATVEMPPIFTPAESAPAAPLVRFSPNDAAIAQFKAEHAAIIANPDASTPEGYEACRFVISVCRASRSAIEKGRVEQKAFFIEGGRRVDTEAKRLTLSIEEVEQPLKLAKAKVDDAAELAKAAAEQAQRNRIAELEAIAAKIEADNRKLALELEEEDRKKREAELTADREKIAEERAKLAEERRAIEAEKQVERDRIASEQRKIDDERERLNRIKFEQEAKEFRGVVHLGLRELQRLFELAEKEAVERAERREKQEAKAHIAAADLARKVAEQEAEESRLIEAARPDVEKIRAFGDAIRALATAPRSALTTEPARLFAVTLHDDLLLLADRCKAYSVPKKKRQAVMS